MGVLTISAKSSPFPYAAAATATFTGKADLVFDDEAATPSLDLDGNKISSEEAIVLALAKAGGLSDDSSKVIHMPIPPQNQDLISLRTVSAVLRLSPGASKKHCRA
jgi:hypothetical protein